MGQGWSAYFRSSFCLAGLALASLYMTVLGFDNITAGYGYSQGLTESTLSLLTAAGAVAGICGSLCFPKLRSVVGPTLAGVIGFSLAVLAQTLSLTSVFLPGTAFAPLARSGAPHTHTSVITLFSGIILARCGLWISDLSVTQLLQERVPEWRRGTISGVQSALNMTMDTAKNLLVVFIPHAQDFGVLIILSYIFWVIGWCLFAVYAATTGRRPPAHALRSGPPSEGGLKLEAGAGPAAGASLAGDAAKLPRSGDITPPAGNAADHVAAATADSDDVTPQTSARERPASPADAEPSEDRPLLAPTVVASAQETGSTGGEEGSVRV